MELIQPTEEDPDPLPELRHEDLPAIEAYIAEQEGRINDWRQYAAELSSEDCRFCTDTCQCSEAEERNTESKIQRHELQLRLARFAVNELVDRPDLQLTSTHGKPNLNITD